MKPTNHFEFLSAIFGEMPEGQTASVAWQDPSGGKVTYPADAWPEASAQDFHTHYSVGLFNRGRGYFRRRKDVWTGCPVIVLDDVGEEKSNGLTIRAPELEPSFIVETKPGSQQWGYLLEEPAENYDEVVALMRGLIKAGYCDPGGNNPCRLVRLPGSQPIGKKHTSKLVEWTGRRYAFEDLPKLFDVTPDYKIGGADTAGAAEISATDPVLVWLMEQGYAHKAGSGWTVTGEGWYEITCPWVEDHTQDGSENLGTGYMPPSKDNPTRGFHCHHRCGSPEHPQYGGKDTNAFLDWVRESGGPDVETLDEVAAEERRRRLAKLREGDFVGRSDPAVIEASRKAKQSTSPRGWSTPAATVVWHLVAQGWNDREILDVIPHLCTGQIDPAIAFDEAEKMIDTARAKQLRKKAREADTYQLQKLFMEIARRLPAGVRRSAARWLEEM